MPLVTVKRDSGLMGIFRDLNFLVDGSVLKKINRGTTETIQIGSGLHNFQVSMDWMKTKPIAVNISNDDELFFECGTGLGLLRIQIHLRLLRQTKS